MFRVNGTYIKMNEGDYGEILTFQLIGGTILPMDNITFIIETRREHEQVLEKKCEYVDEKSFEVQLSQEDTNELSVGTYIWGILQERDGELIDTMEIDNTFIVERGLKDESNNSDS